MTAVERQSSVWNSGAKNFLLIHDGGGDIHPRLNMHNACSCTLFGLNFDSLLNGNVSVGDNRLFKVNVSDQECTVI